MKRIFQFSAVIALLLILSVGCATSKLAQVTEGSRGKFAGTWTVASITYEGIVKSTVSRVFDQAPPAAFVNSVWVLTNSGNGQYTLNGWARCKASTGHYYNPGGGSAPAFQFKKVYQGDKPKKR